MVRPSTLSDNSSFCFSRVKTSVKVLFSMERRCQSITDLIPFLPCHTVVTGLQILKKFVTVTYVKSESCCASWAVRFVAYFETTVARSLNHYR